MGRGRRHWGLSGTEKRGSVFWVEMFNSSISMDDDTGEAEGAEAKVET